MFPCGANVIIPYVYSCGCDCIMHNNDAAVIPYGHVVRYQIPAISQLWFQLPTNQLTMESEVIIQQYNEAPLDFLVADYAIDYPFTYQSDDKILLSPYMASGVQRINNLLVEWIANIWKPTDRIQTYSLLHQICTHIHESLSYRVRGEPGVQTAEQTLLGGTGSCRDFAALFMVAAQYLGFAARFVSGYLHAPVMIKDQLG
jgi:hypothetical protein